MRMMGSIFTYVVGSDASAIFFNSKNDDLNAEEVYSKLVTPVFGKGVAYDCPNSVGVCPMITESKMTLGGVYSRYNRRNLACVVRSRNGLISWNVDQTFL